jgi:ferredoxin
MEIANVTYQDEFGNIKVKIDLDKCIVCGRCVWACKHEARYFEDDTELFFADLAKGLPISLIVAPSIRTNIPVYKRLFTSLKSLGVNKIYDVSVGADICIWAHIKHLEDKDTAPTITQPCPPIVAYCEMYNHDLLSKLSPIHSPMACTSIYMNEYKGINDRIAALSPCMAKKAEFIDTGLADYNITFEHLLYYLKESKITLPDEETDFDNDESGLGSLFPMPGGLKENVEYFLGKKLHIAKAEGFDVYKKLDTYANTPKDFLPMLYDVLNCTEGCNLGNAYSHDICMFEIDKTMDDTRRNTLEEEKREHYKNSHRLFDETLEISRFLRQYKPKTIPNPHITTKNIEDAMELLGKTSYEKQHIDCSACGSDTCFAMARKIALDVNIPENCIFKSKEDAKMEHDENLLAHQQISELEKAYELDMRIRTMLDVSPHVNVLFDNCFNVIDCNSAAITFMGAATKEVLLAGFMGYITKCLPELQSNGQAPPSFKAMLMEAVSNGTVEFDLELLINGATHKYNVNLKKIPYEDSFAIVAYFSEVIDIREREIELARVRESNELRLIKMRDEIIAPLNSISELVELAQKADLPYDSKEHLSGIAKTAKQLIGIVNATL